MSEFITDNAVEALRQAVSRTFPDRHDVSALNFDGTAAQAWQAFSRLLAVDEAQLVRKLAPVFQAEIAGPLGAIPPDVLGLIPAGFCQENQVLPLRFSNNMLLVVTANPADDDLRDRIRFLVDKPVQWALATPQDIDEAIVVNFSKEAERTADALATTGNRAVDENAIVKLGKALLTAAIEQRASDLHIQPYLGSAVARIRVDGNLRRLTMLTDAMAMTLIRHFKARSGMESTNIQIPQDGRMVIAVDGREFDMRVSTLPASRGERLVIRFLDQSRVHKLSGIGFSLAALQAMRRAIARPSGLVIMTGPTGSGKTSTLYSMLAELNRSTVNIITVENPVEYRIPGISQVEVNEKSGRTFLAALRSILRQDPDVVLIGEIRDQETAEIAAQAAMTGHLVLSTLHTNDALTAIPRLLNLGVQPSVLSGSLAAVVAQRLCRQLCTACKIPVSEPLTPEERTFVEMTRNIPGHRAVGCKQCDYTGYRGRLPIVDIVEMTKGLRDAVALGETRVAELEKLRAGGLKSLAASGSMRIISGETTVREVMEAVGPTFWPELAEHYGSVCFDDALDLGAPQVGAGQCVLLISHDAELARQIEGALMREGLRMVVAATAETATELLKKDEDIAFIVGDVPDNASLDEATTLLRHNRQHIAWARLPALVFIATPLAGQEAALRESGVMAALIAKPFDPESFLKQIRRAHAR